MEAKYIIADSGGSSTSWGIVLKTDEVVFIHQGQVSGKQPTEKFLNAPATRQAKAYLAGELLID